MLGVISRRLSLFILIIVVVCYIKIISSCSFMDIIISSIFIGVSVNHQIISLSEVFMIYFFGFIIIGLIIIFELD